MEPKSSSIIGDSGRQAGPALPERDGTADEARAETCLNDLLAGLWTPPGGYVANGIPWPEVVNLAEANRVASSLYGALAHRGAEVPASVAEALHQDYYRVAAMNTLHMVDLEGLLEALVPVAGPLVVLKGAALAERVYGNVALRKIGDVDLLVPMERVAVCREVLGGLGYVPDKVEHRPGSRLLYGNQEMFRHREAGHTTVELHWHLLDVPYYLRKVPLDWFWENTERYPVGSQTALALNPEANVLYLAAHLALHHRSDGLRWFLDLALIVDRHRDRLDWAEIAARAQAFDLLLAVREVVDRLAVAWPSLPLAEAQRRLDEREPARFERRLYRLLREQPRGTIPELYTDLVCLPDARARLRFLWLNVFPQPSYVVQRYGVGHTWQLPYWYFYRLADGLVKTARAVHAGLCNSTQQAP